MDDPLRTALTTFVARGGVLSAPASDSDSDIAAANSELAAHDCPELPLDYVALLKQTDGLMCPGFLLYPVRGEQFSLVSATIKERKQGFHDRCHVVGFVHYELMPVVRDWATGEYRWHDESGPLIGNYASLEMLLEDGARCSCSGAALDALILCGSEQTWPGEPIECGRKIVAHAMPWAVAGRPNRLKRRVQSAYI